jgi:fructose-1,6-bisphosphatase I
MPERKFMTLARHIIETEKLHPEATGELSKLLSDFSLAAKVISLEVNKAGLVDILGFTGHSNVYGEEVKKLDMFAHDTLLRATEHSGQLCVLASEEHEDIIQIPDQMQIGKYVLLFDPLDGSSNIDVNVSVGTIFSIFRRISPSGKPGTLEDCLQPGFKQVAAGYVLYGSSTIMIYTAGHGVHGFTLDPSFGEFLLSHENITIPKRSNIYSINEGNYKYWHPGLKKYIGYLHEEDKETRRPYSLRYVGSMAADIHRNLLYGGIFMYPADSKHKGGKLRLMIECNPMAFIVEAAGGRATDGKKRILEIQPKDLHERTPLFIGSEEDVKMAEDFMAKEESANEIYMNKSK